jgi:hypothetical protein
MIGQANGGMLRDHAIVNKDGWDVSLIGAPPSAVLEECDCCHRDLPLGAVSWTGEEMLCAKCAVDPANFAGLETRQTRTKTDPRTEKGTK